MKLFGNGSKASTPSPKSKKTQDKAGKKGDNNKKSPSTNVKGAIIHSTSNGGKSSSKSKTRPLTKRKTKKILVCFDGTGKEPSDGVQDRSTGELDNGSISNVLKIHFLAGGVLGNQTSHVEGQHSLYYAGVGTRGSSTLQRTFRSAFGSLGPAVMRKEAREDLKRLYKPGDTLCIFGYSRGAACARVFAVELARDGLTLASGKTVKSPTVELLGCFDTVVGSGAPDVLKNSEVSSSEVFENGTVASNVLRAVHCVAIDEKRYFFKPTLMNEEDRVHEVWFAGVHGDVGGGYRDDKLSDTTLIYMMRQASRLVYLKPSQVPKSALTNPKNSEQLVDYKDLRIEKLDPLADQHFSSRKFPYTMLGYRERRNISKVREDKPQQVSPGLVHVSVIQRIKSRPEYRPRNLIGAPHYVVQDDGTVSKRLYFGLNDHLKDGKGESARNGVDKENIAKGN